MTTNTTINANDIREEGSKCARLAIAQCSDEYPVSSLPDEPMAGDWDYLTRRYGLRAGCFAAEFVAGWQITVEAARAAREIETFGDDA